MKSVPLAQSAQTALPLVSYFRSPGKRCAGAFSLTEVVIAMGVATVAFTSIIALFPLGLNMSKESFESTQAALIAKSIMGQIVDVQSGTGNTGFRRITTGTNNDPTTGSLFSFDVNRYTTPTNLYLAYSYATNIDGRNYWKPAATNSSNGISKNAWDSGVSGSTALVRVTLNRVFNGGATYDIHAVEVQVDYPGSVSYTNRTHEIFARICH